MLLIWRGNMFYYLVAIIVSSFFSFAGATDNQHFSEENDAIQISKTPLWQEKIKMVLTPMLTIGTDNIDNENSIFSIIADIEIDHSGCIYVLDALNYRVQKFSSDGKFLSSFGKGKGEGPGEFSIPKAIAVDSQKRLYISDARQFRITVFDSTGRVLATIPTSSMPYHLVVGHEGEIFNTSFLNFNQDRVTKYSLSLKRQVLTFCKPRKECQWVAEAGDAENLAIDRQGNVYVGFFYPYDIRVFSANGKLLNRFARKADFLKPPKRDKNGVMNLLSGTWAMTVLPDNKLITIVFYQEKKQFHFFFDVFDSDGTWLLTVPAEQFGMSWPRIMAADSEGNLYFDHSEPYPHLIKYKIRFEKK